MKNPPVTLVSFNLFPVKLSLFLKKKNELTFIFPYSNEALFLPSNIYGYLFKKRLLGSTKASPHKIIVL